MHPRPKRLVGALLRALMALALLCLLLQLAIKPHLSITAILRSDHSMPRNLRVLLIFGTELVPVLRLAGSVAVEQKRQLRSKIEV